MKFLVLGVIYGNSAFVIGNVHVNKVEKSRTWDFQAKVAGIHQARSIA